MYRNDVDAGPGFSLVLKYVGFWKLRGITDWSWFIPGVSIPSLGRVSYCTKRPTTTSGEDTSTISSSSRRTQRFSSTKGNIKKYFKTRILPKIIDFKIFHCTISLGTISLKLLIMLTPHSAMVIFKNLKLAGYRQMYGGRGVHTWAKRKFTLKTLKNRKKCSESVWCCF